MRRRAFAAALTLAACSDSTPELPLGQTETCAAFRTYVSDLEAGDTAHLNDDLRAIVQAANEDSDHPELRAPAERLRQAVTDLHEAEDNYQPARRETTELFGPRRAVPELGREERDAARADYTAAHNTLADTCDARRTDDESPGRSLKTP